MQQSAPLAILLALGIIAVVTSQKKWLAALFALGWAMLGFAIGATVGFAFGARQPQARWRE
jgi:NhaP-type Na+/H+ and K+/H+ antiporter